MATSKKILYIYNNPHVNRIIIPRDITGKKYYLYVHYRIDKMEPFYIGIGTSNKKDDYYRATCFKKRSGFWKRVCNKTKYDVMIINESDNKQDILDKEINYIKIFGKRIDKTGTLVNFTDGGEGIRGYNNHTMTLEGKAKIAESNRSRIISTETREKLRLALQARGIINKK
jgi:hypothetical protein